MQWTVEARVLRTIDAYGRPSRTKRSFELARAVDARARRFERADQTLIASITPSTKLRFTRSDVVIDRLQTQRTWFFTTSDTVADVQAAVLFFDESEVYKRSVQDELFTER